MSTPTAISYDDAPTPAALIEQLLANTAAAAFLATNFPGQDAKELLGTFNNAITTMNFAVLNKLGQATIAAESTFAVATNTTPTRGPKCALRGMRCVGKTLVLSYMRSGELGFFDLRYGVESSACGGTESGREGFGGEGTGDGNGPGPVDPGTPEDPNYIEPTAWPTKDTMQNLNASNFVLAEYRTDTQAKWTPVRIADANASISQANKTPMTAAAVKAIDLEIYSADYSSGAMKFGPAKHRKAIAIDHRMGNPLFATEATRLYGEVDEGVFENMSMLTGQTTRVVAEANSAPIKAAIQTYVGTNKTLMYHQEVKKSNFDIDIDFFFTSSITAENFNRSNNVLWIGLKPKGDGTYIGGFPIAFGRIYTPSTMGASNPDYSALAMSSSKIVSTLPEYNPNGIYFAVPKDTGGTLELVGYYSPISTANGDQIVPETLGNDIGDFMSGRPGAIYEGMEGTELIIFENGTPVGVRPGAYAAAPMRKTRMKIRVQEVDNRTVVSVSVYGSFGSNTTGIGDDYPSQWNLVANHVFDDVIDLKGYVALESTKREPLDNVALRATNPTGGIMGFTLSDISEEANSLTTEVRIANGETFKNTEYIGDALTKADQETAARAFLSKPESAAILRQGFTTKAGGMKEQVRDAKTMADLKETFVFAGNDGFDLDLHDMVVYYGEPFELEYFQKAFRIEDSTSGLGGQQAVPGKGSYIRLGSTIDPKYAESFMEWLHGSFFDSKIFTAKSSKTGQSLAVAQIQLDEVFFAAFTSNRGRQPAVLPLVVEFTSQATGTKSYYWILLSMDPKTNLATCWSARSLAEFNPGEPTLYPLELTEPGVDLMNQENIFKVFRPITTDYNTAFSMGAQVGIDIDSQLQNFVTPLTAATLDGEECVSAAGSYYDPMAISDITRFDIIVYPFLTKDLNPGNLVFDIDLALPVEENFLFGQLGYTEVEAPSLVDGRVRPSTSITQLKYYSRAEISAAAQNSPIRVLDMLTTPQAKINTSENGEVAAISVYNGIVYYNVLANIDSSNIRAAEVLRGYRNYVTPVRVTVRDQNDNSAVRGVFYMTFAIGGMNRLGTAWLTPHAIVGYSATLTPSRTSASLAANDMVGLTLEVKRNGIVHTPVDVMYESSDPAVATVDAAGVVTLVAEGTFTITASDTQWEAVSEPITVVA